MSLSYGHDGFSAGPYRDTTPHVESQLMSYGVNHPFLWPQGQRDWGGGQRG